jgi:hypothetical protein
VHLTWSTAAHRPKIGCRTRDGMRRLLCTEMFT